MYFILCHLKYIILCFFKVVEDLSHQICKYHSLAVTIGTSVDNESLRQELLERQQKACDTVISTTTQLSDAFRRLVNTFHFYLFAY